MAASIRKNLSFFIFKHASNHNVRSPLSLSISLRLFSAQTPTHLDLNSNPSVYDVLVHKHHFPCQFASWLSSELAHVKNPERVDSVLTFFKSIGFSNAQLQKMLKSDPRRVACLRLEDNLKPKIKGLQEEGFSSGDIPKIISREPRLLGMSLINNIIPSLSVLKGLLGSTSAVIRAVRNLPQILSSNVEGNVVANVEFLKNIGISVDRIRIMLISDPSTFSIKPEVMRAAVEKAKDMGPPSSSKAFIYAIATIASMTNKAFELKLQAFRDTGFSESDISSMFRKEPRVFLVSSEKMKTITEGLVVTGKFDISSIVRYPNSLMFSFEKRYKSRMRILRILESRKLIEDWPTLPILCKKSDAEFFKRFVSPYLDHLSDVDISMFSAIGKVKTKP